MSDHVWIAVFVVSVIILIVVSYKSKVVRKWLGWILANMAVAALLLYVVNVTGWFGDITIPINTFTMIISAILGLPGMLALMAISAWII